MPEPHEQNPSGFDEPAAGASRFWHQYGAARAARATGRNGEREGPAPEGAPEHECLEWCPICRGAEVVRSTTPPELREQLQTVQRDALVLMRTLIDAYLERLGDGARRRGEQRVEDIPIE